MKAAPVVVAKKEAAPAPVAAPKVVEEKKEAVMPPKEKKAKKEKAPPAKAAEAAGDLSKELAWWNQCDLRVGKIVECGPIEGSDKLFLEAIDIGEGSNRTIGSGVRNIIPVEEMLKDEFCVVFANLKPKKLGPIPASHGMVMMASNEAHDKIEILRPPKGSKLGERIQIEGNVIPNFSQEMQAVLNPKKKVSNFLLELVKTNDKSEATFNGMRWVTSAGPLKCATLKNGPIS